MKTRSMRQLCKTLFGLIILTIIYFFVACLITYPLITNLDKGLYGYKGDNMLYMHDLWVWSEKYIKKAEPVLGEIKYSKITTQPILDGTATILTSIFEPLKAYNILILFSFVFTGLFTYIFILKITKNPLASFFAGLAFSFSSYHLRHSQNHLEISQLEVIPLYLIFLERFLEKRSVKRAVVTGITLAVATLTVNYYGFFLGIASLFYLCFFGLAKKSRLLKPVATLFLTTATIVLLVNIPYIKLVIQKTDFNEITWKAIGKQETDYIKYAAKPWFYLLPDIENPSFGQLSSNALIEISKKSPFYLTKNFSANEHSLFVGGTVLVLCGVGILLKLKHTKKFLILALIMIIISLPPFIYFKNIQIPLPSFILMKFFPMFRVYARFGVLAQFFLVTCASITLTLFLSGTRKFWRKLLVTLSFCVLILLEFFIPAKFQKLFPAPPEYVLAKEQKLTLLESPKLEDHTNIFYQTFHNNPVYFVRTTKQSLVDINDLNAQLTGQKLIVFRGDFKQRFFDHKYNELGLDLENTAPRTDKDTEAKKDHLDWINKNVDIIKSVAGIKNIFHYDETYVFEYGK